VVVEKTEKTNPNLRVLRRIRSRHHIWRALREVFGGRKAMMPDGPVPEAPIRSHCEQQHHGGSALLSNRCSVPGPWAATALGGSWLIHRRWIGCKSPVGPVRSRDLRDQLLGANRGGKGFPHLYTTRRAVSDQGGVITPRAPRSRPSIPPGENGGRVPHLRQEDRDGLGCPTRLRPDRRSSRHLRVARLQQQISVRLVCVPLGR